MASSAGLKMYNCAGSSKVDRYFCTACGTKVYSTLKHLGTNTKAVYLQNLTIPNHGDSGKIDDRFKPGCHIFYGSGTVSIFDKLPKFASLPPNFGGDGRQLPNDAHAVAENSAAPFDTSWMDEPAGKAALAQSKGSCHCGAVAWEVTGLPKWTARCHCSVCRMTHSADSAELCAFDATKVSVTKGEDRLAMYRQVRGANPKGSSKRYFCSACGSSVYSSFKHFDGAATRAINLQNLTTPNHGEKGKIDDRFKMGCHIFYGSGTTCMYDKLGKYRTLPKAFGGDGKRLASDYHDWLAKQSGSHAWAGPAAAATSPKGGGANPL